MSVGEGQENWDMKRKKKKTDSSSKDVIDFFSPVVSISNKNLCFIMSLFYLNSSISKIEAKNTKTPFRNLKLK